MRLRKNTRVFVAARQFWRFLKGQNRPACRKRLCTPYLTGRAWSQRSTLSARPEAIWRKGNGAGKDAPGSAAYACGERTFRKPRAESEARHALRPEIWACFCVVRDGVLTCRERRLMRCALWVGVAGPYSRLDRLDRSVPQMRRLAICVSARFRMHSLRRRGRPTHTVRLGLLGCLALQMRWFAICVPARFRMHSLRRRGRPTRAVRFEYAWTPCPADAAVCYLRFDAILRVHFLRRVQRPIRFDWACLDASPCKCDGSLFAF